MHFGNPIVLWSLALFPVLVLVGVTAERRRRRTREIIGQATLVTQLFHDSIPVWRRRRVWMGLVVYLLLAISAARPQYGRIEQTIRRAGVDVLIAIDTSPSMLATDVNPNRLEAAKASLKRLVRKLEGNRIGIVAFAGDAFLVCPMTLDYALAELVLGAIDSETVTVSGTDLGRTIDIARGAFSRGGEGTPVLVLLTDGEDNEGRGREAAEQAANDGIRIFSIGIGTERGAPIPEGDRGYKENAEGNKVVTRLDMSGLQAISSITGGLAYSAGGSPAPAVQAIIDQIDRLEKGDYEAQKLVIYQDRFGWFVVPAALILLWLIVSRSKQLREPGSNIAEEFHATRVR